MGIEFAVDDPLAADVAELLTAHLAFSRSTSPACHDHSLEIERLCQSDITFVSAREDGSLLAIGALKKLTGAHGEIKSMHTAPAARGRGIGKAMVEHLLTVAAELGCVRVSLETGTQEGFAPARSLYLSMGFAECEPFADYSVSPHSVYMTRTV